MKRVLFFILSYGLVLSAHAQKDVSLKLANDSFKKANYYQAIVLYEEILKVAPKNIEASFKYAESLYAARDLKKAVKAYDHFHSIIVKDKELKNQYYITYLHRGNALMATQRYKEAQIVYLELMRMHPQDKNFRQVKRLANAKIKSCTDAELLLSEQYLKEFEVQRMEEGVNTPYSDFGPVWVNDNELLYTTLHEDTLLVVDRNSDFMPVNNIYRARKSSAGWNTPEHDANYNHDFLHTANGNFSKDKKSFAFSVCQENANHEIKCAIYISYKKHNAWSKPEKLKSGINEAASTSTQPTFGEYRRRRSTAEVLYFVSDRVGGKGGLDIWYSAKDRVGRWAPPVNCGSGINTAGNEITPFYDFDNETMFFSSDGHSGLGGYDVFSSTGGLKSWRRPSNLGAAINSGYDDTYFSYRVSGANGTLVSNRDGAASAFGQNCCDDIYYFNQKLIYNLPGIVVNTDSVAIPYAEIGVSLVPDSVSWMPEPTEDGQFKLKYRADKPFNIIAKKKGYNAEIVSAVDENNDFKDSVIIVLHKAIEDMQPIASKTTTQLPVSIDEKEAEIKYKEENMAIDQFKIDRLGRLTPAPKAGDLIRLPNVFFEFGKTSISKMSAKQLDMLVKIMNAAPDMQVEIAGHTDSKGEESFNQKLSQDRADEVKRYLEEHGINAMRVKAVGYGENKPLALNTNPDGSDNEGGRALNRRIEVLVIKN